jgi:hypothetical protein
MKPTTHKHYPTDVERLTTCTSSACVVERLKKLAQQNEVRAVKAALRVAKDARQRNKLLLALNIDPRCPCLEKYKAAVEAEKVVKP